MVPGEVLVLQHRAAVLEVEAEASAAGGAGADPMLRSSTISFFSGVSTTVLDSTGLPTMVQIRSMSVCWRRKCKRSGPKLLCAAETGT